MNILMLGRWLPPPRQPVRGTREYHFARHLAARHQLTLVFVADNPDSLGAISTLRAEFHDLEFAAVPRTWRSVAGAVSLVSGESCTLSYFRSEALRARLADRLRRTRYDLVLVSSSSMLQYAIDIEPSIPMLMDLGDVDSEWWFRRAADGQFPARRFFRAEASRLRSAEAAAVRRAAGCVVASEAAAQIVRTLGAATPPTIIPNGVNVDFFASSPRTGSVPTVVFNGSLSRAVDIQDASEFCRVVLPLVRARIPEARFVVYSRDPVPTGRSLTELTGVEVVGSVTDVRPLLHTAAVAAASGRPGSDLRSTVLEPLAAGIPVVAPSRVREQLFPEVGHGIRIADHPSDVAWHLVELLEDSRARAAAGAAGRSYVAAQYGWTVVTAGLSEIAEATAGPARAPAATHGSITRAGQ
jgi:glycosyltransferase involved in cell wall biosynthesis